MFKICLDIFAFFRGVVSPLGKNISEIMAAARRRFSIIKWSFKIEVQLWNCVKMNIVADVPLKCRANERNQVYLNCRMQPTLWKGLNNKAQGVAPVERRLNTIAPVRGL